MLASSVAGLKAGTREHDLKLGGFLGGSNKGSRPWRKSHCTLKKQRFRVLQIPLFFPAIWLKALSWNVLAIQGYEGMIFLATNRPFDLDEVAWPVLCCIATCKCRATVGEVEF